MQIKNNPFTDDLFATAWQNNFQSGKDAYTFPHFKGLQFFRVSGLPLYINVGRNHTKGISYTYSPIASDTGNSVFLIYDIPHYFELEGSESGGSLAKISVGQYPGYLIDTDGYQDLTQYMRSSFSKSSRYKLNKYKKRFEQSFEVAYKMYYGEIEKTTYDWLFEQFRQLLEKRFDEKQITNNNLDQKEWSFYETVTYPMILEKKAALFVVYDGDLPIAITLNYLSDTILFDAITVFDIEYGKFHLGSVSIMGLIEWCIKNNIKILDFSKGAFDYKSRWCTREYNFDYHLYYNPKSVISASIAHLIANFFRLKQFLREKNINEKFHQLTYRLSNKTRKIDNLPDFEFNAVHQDLPEDDLIELDWTGGEYRFLKPLVFNFLYLNGEARSDFKVFKSPSDHASFIFKGKSTCTEVTCETLADVK